MLSKKAPALPARQQRGAVVILFALLIGIILGFMGLALDLSRVYNRQIEMQAVADTAALSAARKLVGTDASVDSATSAATAAVALLKFNYGKENIAWSSSAVQFSASAASGSWVDAATARAAPGTMAYVKVDTAVLDPAMGNVDTMIMRAIQGPASVTARASAIAGRSALNIIPLAICAMSPVAAASRAPGGELVQYGFRRGVAYDLMNLNPDATTPAENFVINPIDSAGSAGFASNTAHGVVGPFVCSGTMPIASATAAPLLVSRPFPLATLYQHLNSRFDQYAIGGCKFRSAPPDTNIKQYTFSTVPWMRTAQPTTQTAEANTTGGKLRTVADPYPPVAAAPEKFGPMWSFARPVPFSAYTAGVPEPAGGYTPFARSSWAALYAPGVPEPKTSYPAQTPYLAPSAAYKLVPPAGHGAVLNRRVLNVPLLACPVASGANVPATVLAIGRFFMTVPATATSISAEFAGVANEAGLTASVELYQ